MPSLRKFLRNKLLSTITLLAYTTPREQLAQFMEMVRPARRIDRLGFE